MKKKKLKLRKEIADIIYIILIISIIILSLIGIYKYNNKAVNECIKNGNNYNVCKELYK